MCSLDISGLLLYGESMPASLLTPPQMLNQTASARWMCAQQATHAMTRRPSGQEGSTRTAQNVKRISISNRVGGEGLNCVHIQ